MTGGQTGTHTVAVLSACSILVVAGIVDLLS